MKKNMKAFLAAVCAAVITVSATPVMAEEVKERIIEKIVYKEVNAAEKSINTTSKIKGSYLATVQGKYDDVIFFDEPDVINGVEIKEGQVWTSEQPDIATVDKNGVVTGWSEGLATISDGKQTYTIAVTTKNDGKDPVTYLSYVNSENPDANGDPWSRTQSSFAAEYADEAVDTLREAYQYIIQKGMRYYDNGILATQCWTWSQSPATMIETQRGVCCEAATLITYLLRYDYEEVGQIYVTSKTVGHAYNYIYEDGKYYVFDPTNVISYMAFEWDGNWNDRHFSRYMEFPVQVADSLQDLKQWMLDYTIAEDCIAIWAINSMNLGVAIPTHFNGMQNSRAIDFKNPEIKIVCGLEKGWEYELIYTVDHPGFEFVEFATKDVPKGVPTYFE